MTTVEACTHRWTSDGASRWCRDCGEVPPKVLQPGANQLEVESEILRLSAKLEEATDALAVLLQEEARTEVEHKRAWAKATLRSTEGTVAQREAEAVLSTVDELMDRKVAEALADAQKALCHSLRAQLSALQTLAANIRAQV